MHAKLKQLREERANGEHGFTLIELLVVVVIIGILVAIAIPLYLNFRKGAENRSAQSDVRNGVTTIEQCFNDGGQQYPTTAISGATASTAITCGSSPNQGTGTIALSTGNTLSYTYTATGTNAKTYTLYVKNTDSGVSYSYDSSTGVTTKGT